MGADGRQAAERRAGVGGEQLTTAALCAADLTAVERCVRNGCRAFTHNVNYAARERERPALGAAHAFCGLGPRDGCA